MASLSYLACCGTRCSSNTGDHHDPMNQELSKINTNGISSLSTTEIGAHTNGAVSTIISRFDKTFRRRNSLRILTGKDSWLKRELDIDRLLLFVPTKSVLIKLQQWRPSSTFFRKQH
ncbi:hypothetical protein CsSME_00022495 [Camellia sinensis var. sinensis]